MLTVVDVTVDWGNVPAWTSAAVTTAGFAAAVKQLQLGRRDRQEEREQAQSAEAERREAMARAVGVKVDWGDTDETRGLTRVIVQVMNGGPYPISGAVIVIEADEFPTEVVIGTLLAGESLKDTHKVRRTGLTFGELTSGATLRFTDTYGKHWSRTPNDLVAEDLPAPSVDAVYAVHGSVVSAGAIGGGGQTRADIGQGLRSWRHTAEGRSGSREERADRAGASREGRSLYGR